MENMINFERQSVIDLIDLMATEWFNYGIQVSNQLNKWGFDYKNDEEFLDILQYLGDDQLKTLVLMKTKLGIEPRK